MSDIVHCEFILKVTLERSGTQLKHSRCTIFFQGIKFKQLLHFNARLFHLSIVVKSLCFQVTFMVHDNSIYFYGSHLKQ
jgi:hypothetical protein